VLLSERFQCVVNNLGCCKILLIKGNIWKANSNLQFSFCVPLYKNNQWLSITNYLEIGIELIIFRLVQVNLFYLKRRNVPRPANARVSETVFEITQNFAGCTQTNFNKEFWVQNSHPFLLFLLKRARDF